MHRMMPYELVGVPERREVMEKINRDPNGWVQSLKTFGKYGFFVECDIEAPVELHDKFNDLPFFPVQKAGMYSDGIKKYAEKNDIVDKVKEVNTPKLICDLVPRPGHSTGISCHTHSPHHSIQAGTIHLRVREHVE